MKLYPVAVLLASAFLLAQTGDTDKLERHVQGQVLTSESDPAVQITFDKRYKYAGGQRFILYGVAEAEQHFFVQAAADGKIESFYWLQFEHYLPSNDHQYDYPPKRTMKVGGLTFVHDTATFSNYAGMQRQADSDGAKAVELLTKKGFKLPAGLARTRMFYLTDNSKRKELMIIYGQAVVVDNFPKNGSRSDDEKQPEFAAHIRKLASEGMKIENR